MESNQQNAKQGRRLAGWWGFGLFTISSRQCALSVLFWGRFVQRKCQKKLFFKSDTLTALTKLYHKCDVKNLHPEQKLKKLLGHWLFLGPWRFRRTIQSNRGSRCRCLAVYVVNHPSPNRRGELSCAKRRDGKTNERVTKMQMDRSECARPKKKKDATNKAKWWVAGSG